METPLPFYTINDEEKPVYHDNENCEEGKKIKEENRVYGTTGGRKKCDKCAELDGDNKSLWG